MNELSAGLEKLPELKESGLKMNPNADWNRSTSLGAGSAPFFLAEPVNTFQLRNLLKTLKQLGIPASPLGAGTNTAGSDEKLDRVFIRLGGDFAKAAVSAGHVVCGAALPLSKLIDFAAKNGYGGAAGLAGIPGTVGGAIRMNAGANGLDISRFLISANGFDLDSGDAWFLNAETEKWGYRESPVPEPIIITEAVFRFPNAEAEEEKKKIFEERERRRIVTPPGRSAGSIFRNPPGKLSAGELLDRAECKGMKCGAFHVSPIHANWIIRDAAKPASERELRELMREMKEKVNQNLTAELRFVNQPKAEN